MSTNREQTDYGHIRSWIKFWVFEQKVTLDSLQQQNRNLKVHKPDVIKSQDRTWHPGS